VAGSAVRIAILANASQARSEFDSTAKKASGFGDKMGKVGKVAGRALAGGLLLAGAAAVKMTKAAAEDEAAQSSLAKTLQNVAGASKSQIAAAESWIEVQGKTKGIADDELRPALAKLVTATHDVGKAQRLASLAMDISAGSGKSLESVSALLAKAQNGSAAGLAKLGVKTKDAAGKTRSLKDITADLASTYKGSASKAAETTAGKQKILTVQMGELQEKIGAKLLPVMQSLVDVGLKVIDWISRNTTLVGILVGSLAGLLVITKAVSLATQAWSAVTKIWSAATKAMAAVQWLLNAAMSANPIALVVIAIVALVAAFVIAWKKSDKFRAIVTGAFDKVKAAASAVFDWVKKNWPLLLAIITGPIGLAVLAIVKNFDKIKAGFQAVIDFIKGIPAKITALGSKFLEAGSAIMGKIIEGIKSAAGFIGKIASGIWDAVKGLINTAIDKINTALSFSINLPFGKHITIDPPDIPHLASGGIITGPTIALLGEAGREAVIPLDHGLLGNVNIYKIHITAPVGSSSADIGRDITRHIEAYERAGGRRRA
jgi:hypothetical protein